MGTIQVKEFVDDLKIEWKSLWQDRIEDKVRAEGIAKQDYSKLAVEQGTVIMATRDYKPLEFFDIVQNYLGLDTGKVVVPNTTLGGWGKFIRTNIRKQQNTTRILAPSRPIPKKVQQQKKGGRGWRHAKLF